MLLAKLCSRNKLSLTNIVPNKINSMRLCARYGFTGLNNNNDNSEMKKNSNQQFSFQDKIKVYHKLCRNDKPIGIYLLYWPTAWGVILGATSVSVLISFNTVYMLGLFFMGSWTARSAGCIVNDLFDRDFDKQVQRTKMRPLASGQVSVKQALALLFANLFGGVIVLFHLPFNALCFTMGIVTLAGLYPLAKRYTNYPQFILGIGFNSGVVIAGLALNPTLNPIFLLPYYISGICWTMIYDTVYAYQDIDDDLRIGIKSTAVKWKDKDPKKIMEKWGWMMIALHGILPIIDMDLWLTSALLIGCDLQLLRVLKALNLSDKAACGQFFKHNNYYGISIFISLILGGLYYQHKNSQKVNK